MKRCLVTGYTGFIGKYLVAALLREGWYIRGLSRQPSNGRTHPGVDTILGDLTIPETLDDSARSVDTVIHGAGHAHSATADPELHRKTTLEGTGHLLAEAEKSGVQRFVFVSSVKAMRDPGGDCIDETDEGLPGDEYGLSRRQAEDLVLSSGHRTGMHVSILRPALVYGPGCKGNLASMLRWIDRGLFPPVPDTGNNRSMVDVRDLVKAILLATEQEPANGRIFIITDGQNYSTRRIYTAMRTAFGKSMPRGSVPAGLLRTLGRVGDIYSKTLKRPALFNSEVCSRLLDSACYRPKYAEPYLGFRPSWRFEDALPEMVAAYRGEAETLL